MGDSPVTKQGKLMLAEGRIGIADTSQHLAKMKVYKKHEKFFSGNDFIPSIAGKVLPLPWLTVWDIYQLFAMGKKIPDGGTYLEIGSYIGGSLICVYEATKISGAKIKFIGIENNVRPKLYKNTKSIPYLKIIGSRSDKAKGRIRNNSADLLFIDGAHHYEQVKRDILNYWPKLKIGGILLGHDYTHHKQHQGIVKAANEAFGRRLTVLKNSRIFMVERTK